MTEHHFETVRMARYATLGALGPDTREVWFVCHGYRQLATRFLRRFARIDDGSRYLVAPEGLSRFYVDPAPGAHGPEHRVGASWMTREDREVEIRDYVRYLDALADHVLADAGDADVVVLGFSQGVHTVARWTVLGRVAPHRLILWGAYLPPDLDMGAAARALGGVRLTLVRGTSDPTSSEELAAREAERLEEWGIAYEIVTHPGGHKVEEEALQTITEPRE